MTKQYTMDAAERFWIGPEDPDRHTVMRMQRQATEEQWLATRDRTEFDPAYSEYSVRIYDRNIPSLSFLHRTIAILPKSRLRSIYNLIGEYLDNYNN